MNHKQARNRWLARCASLVHGALVMGLIIIAAPLWADDTAWRGFMAAATEASKRDDRAAAAAQFDNAVKSAASWGPADERLAAALYGLGRAKRGLHEYKSAEQNYLRALDIVDAVPVAGVSRADVLDGLGDVYRMQGRYKDSESAYKRALVLLEQSHGATHPLVAQALTNNLASLYRARGRYEEAEAAYVRSLAILEKSVPADDRRLGLALIDLGEWHYERQRYNEAEPLYRRGVPIVQKMLPPAHPRALELLQDWGRVVQMQGRYAEAEAIYKKMQTVAEQTHGKDHPLVAAAFSNLAGVYAVQGRYAEEQAARERALDLAELPFRTFPYAPNVGPQAGARQPGQPGQRLAPPVLQPSAPLAMSASDYQPGFTSAPVRALSFPASVRAPLLARRR